ncbi:hypothetical protein [Clostridium baratii]|uniref:hypothetical protein n=1 Tax=Clostridium baratii TaxID=1561 RepID=UPI0030D5A95E
MKIPMVCKKCYSSVEWVTFNDDGVFKYKCGNNHITYSVCYNEKFEILFEKGVGGLKRGDYYSASICFAAALERFYEFAIKVMLHESEIAEDEINEAFKGMNRSSERELGAFYILYLKEFRKACPKMGTTSIKFRNKVIHKGYMPTYGESLKYGEQVLSYIRDIEKRLASKYSTEKMFEVAFKRIGNLMNKVSEEEKIEFENISTISMHTIIGLENINTEQEKVTIEQYLKRSNGLL